MNSRHEYSELTESGEARASDESTTSRECVITQMNQANQMNLMNAMNQ